MLSTLAIIAASMVIARAQVIPSEPAPGKDFPIGGQCSFSWQPDTSGTWGTTYVELMTGSNDAMVHLTTVYQFDGTDASLTAYTFPCPDVTPHSAIYFYQFTSTGSQSPQWTGRFSISANHDLVAPENTDAKGVAWGTGALTDPTTAVAAPPTSPQAPGGDAPPPASSTSAPTTPMPPPATSAPAQNPPTTTNPGPGHPIPPAGPNPDTYVPPSVTSVDTTPTTGAASSLSLSISALAVIGAIALVAL